jgi:beta-galactosidase
MAWEQFALPLRAVARRRPPRPADLDILRTADALVVAAPDFSCALDPADGQIRLLSTAKHDLGIAGPRPQLWRAATDNDGIRTCGENHYHLLWKWLKAGYHEKPFVPEREATLRRTAEGAIGLLTRYRVDGDHGEALLHCTQRLQFRGDGWIVGTTEFKLAHHALEAPRLGVELVLPAGFETMEWLGRGPHESYCDRQAGAAVGRWRDTVASRYVPYVMPQEHGNLTEVRWIAVHNGRLGLLVAADGDLFQASASHFTAADLFAARHTSDLRPRPETHLNLDCRQRGLGTATCGPDTLGQYRIPPGKYVLGWRMRLFDPRRDDPGILARN